MLANKLKNMKNYEKGYNDQEVPREEIVPAEITPEIKPDINIINGALEILEKEEERKEENKKPHTIH